MPELIFNALPLTEAERAQFCAAAPDAVQRFLPLMDNRGLTVPLSDPAAVEGATVVLGCLPVDVLSASPTLKWLQTWSAGVDMYLKPGALPQGVMLTSAVGAYGPSVAEHLFACLLALLKHLPQYRDNQRAHRWADLGTVKTLAGATVLVIEHDLDVIRNADYLIDMGPGGGESGGRVVAAGTPDEVAACADSLTGRYLH